MARAAVLGPPDFYQAACYLARCVPLTEKDEKLPEAKRTEMARAALRQAIARLPMYVEAICPVCFAKHIVPAERRGEQHRCEGCEEVFIVNWKARTTRKRPRPVRRVRSADGSKDEVLPADVPEVLPVVPGASAKKRRAESPERSRKRGRKRTRWIIAIAGAAALLGGLMGGAVWWAVSPGDERQAQANATAASDTGNAALPVARGRLPAADPASAKIDPSRLEPPKPDEPAWKVRPDAPAIGLKLPADFRKELPIRAAGPGVLFPTAASSPVVALGDNLLADDERQVWDLRANLMLGKLTGSKFSTNPPVLSPDGAHLAIVPFGKQSAVSVWSVKTQKSVPIDPGFTPGLIDFAGPGKLLVADLHNAGLRLQVWNASTGQREREFEGPSLGNVTSLTRDMLALSPGGRYLAIVAPGELWIWDLKIGSAAGRHPVPWNARSLLFPCRGLSFSPDGRELAGLFEVSGQSRLVCWDVARGQEAFDVTFPVLKLWTETPLTYAGQVLGWIGPRQGWLLYGHAIINRRTGKVIAPPGLDRPGLPFRRMLGPDHIATATGGEGGQKVLRIARFRADGPGD